MRARVLSSFPALAMAMLGACAHGGGPAAISKNLDLRAPSGPSPGAAQYLVADPSTRGNMVALPLGASGAVGLVVNKTRVVMGRGEPRIGVDLPDKNINGAAPIPGRFGGGFLFWTENVVYRAGTFEGPLQPIAKMPDAIHVVSFAPKFLLVRTSNGERWALGIPSGDRVPLEPLGAADVEGLDDGRALAFDDQGASFSSTDHGAHWISITTQVRSSPTRIAVVDDEIWLYESSGSALRLELDGRLSAFDKQPVEKVSQVRAPDPRWRGTEAPLRAALQRGAAVDERTAIVVEQGDIIRVDVHSGAISAVTSGMLPPEARCEAVPTANDVLFACVSRGTGSSAGAATAFVVSHTLSGDPVIEQTFPTLAPFYASDDGGLAFAGLCSGAATTVQDHTVCVRQPSGSWQDYDLSALTGDAGGVDVNVARWVPRVDGSAVAILLNPTAGIYDPRTGGLEVVDESGREALVKSAGIGYAALKYRRHTGLGIDIGGIVDSAWSFSASGSLRGWHSDAGIYEIDGAGKVTRSPYAFSLVTAGPNGLGVAEDGRLFQSTDHGGSWTEVAAPPTGTASGLLRGCSTAGCDLGGFYRIGWAARPPRVEAAPTPARAAPEVRRTRPLELSCRPSGAAQSKVLPRTADSPDDLGLGNRRLPVTGGRVEAAFVRTAIPRGIVHPLHEPTGGDSDAPSLRAMLTGFATSRDGDVFEVSGPNKRASSLKRILSFVPPFDASAPIKKATLAMSDVLAAGHLAGMTNDDILSDDMTESGTIVAITPHDALAAADLAFHNTRGLLALVRSNERVRLAMRPTQNEGTVISGVSLGADDAAFLELESTGVGHVFRMGGAGVTDLFDVNPGASDGAFYPANPDALAIGPRGDLAVIRTGSGSDPASSHDPALLITPATPAVALAPWSTLRLADDPACKEPGWRATLQIIAPWIRITTPELRASDLPMIARVKWSEKRVCLEGVELQLPDVNVRAPGPNGSESLKVTSWLVARGSTFARVAIADGVEWRQPLECSVVAPRP